MVSKPRSVRPVSNLAVIAARWASISTPSGESATARAAVAAAASPTVIGFE
jgi:hypothetical protein